MKLTLRKPKLKFEGMWDLFIKIGSNTLSQFLVLIIVLLIINLISQNYFLRIDLTENKVYSLSGGTKNIINSFDERITIKVFFSDNLPPDIIPVTQDVKDIFEEYVRYSNGKIKLEVKNPKDENFKAEAIEASVPEIQFSEFSKDKFEIATGFLGASIFYNDQKETIELINRVDNLEYETSSRIYKLTQEEKPTVGFLTGHGEKNIYSDYSTINKILGRQFNVQTVDLSEGESIDPDVITVLVIAAPTDKFSQRDIFELDQYIMQEGKVFVLTDLYQLDFQNPLLNKIDNNLNEFLSHYGAEVQSSIILDESFLPIISGFQQIAYPYWILAQSENINKENPALNPLESAVFFWASPIKETRVSDEQKFTPLVKSTTKAWESSGDIISIRPDDIAYPVSQKQYTLAALLEGKQISIFKDQDIPQLDDSEKEDKRTPDDIRVDESENSKIVIIGDADFIIDDLLNTAEENAILFLNILEWLSGSEELLEIRSKNIEIRPLEIIPESQKAIVKTSNIALIPIIVISLGIGYNIYWKKRKG